LLFGILFSQGVIAALVFRVMYYFVPFVATMPLHWLLLREKLYKKGIAEQSLA
jgi:hypothetical protein